VRRPIGDPATLPNRRSVWGAPAGLADRETRELAFDIDLAVRNVLVTDGVALRQLPAVALRALFAQGSCAQSGGRP